MVRQGPSSRGSGRHPVVSAVGSRKKAAKRELIHTGAAKRFVRRGTRASSRNPMTSGILDRGLPQESENEGEDRARRQRRPLGVLFLLEPVWLPRLYRRQRRPVSAIDSGGEELHRNRVLIRPPQCHANRVVIVDRDRLGTSRTRTALSFWLASD